MNTQSELQESRKVDIYDINKRYNEWAEKQFPNSTPVSSLRGLVRECIECIESIYDFNKYINSIEYVKGNYDIMFDCFYDSVRLEYADCIMYLIDSARRYGIDTNYFIEIKDEYNDDLLNSIQTLEMIIDELKNLIDFLSFENKHLYNILIINKYTFIYNSLFQSSEKFGLSKNDLFLSLYEKLQINLKRDWKINEDNSYSHVK